MALCVTCQGQRTVRCGPCVGTGMKGGRKCTFCRGTGRMVCSACKGTGQK